MVPRLLFLFVLTTSIAAAGPNEATKEACTKFKERLTTEKKAHFQYLNVPRNYKRPAGKKGHIFFWERPALDPAQAYPPLLLLHGGPGSNSSSFYTWSAVIEKYPGPVVASEHRGEGCSNWEEYFLRYDQYKDYATSSMLKDIEKIRVHLYGRSAKWRVFGHSRGAMLAQRYLESFPNSLESVVTHGMAPQKREGYEKYTITRARAHILVAEAFGRKHPKAKDAISKMREWLRDASTQICWKVDVALENLPEDQRASVCGTLATDSIPRQLRFVSNWPAASAKLEQLLVTDAQGNSVLDLDKANTYLDDILKSETSLKNIAYTFGTHSQEIGAHNPPLLERFRNDPDFHGALISEGRFILDAVYKFYVDRHGQGFSIKYRPYDFDKVRRALESRKKSGAPLKVTFFIGEFDPIAPLASHDDAKIELRSVVDFRFLLDTGHEYEVPEIVDAILRR